MRHASGFGIIALVLLAGCGGSDCGSWYGEVRRVSVDEAREALSCLADLANQESEGGGGMPTSASTDFSAGSTNDSITNNQVSGVDEGDIVKRSGDSLVVLRKGRLYAVSTSGTLQQTDSIRVASDDSLNQNVWYDELLVQDNRAYVIGYRYSDGSEIIGMTEINSFLLQSGRFTRGTTVFIESNDYYDSNNYTSRLQNGKLVLYMPFNGLATSAGQDYRARMPHYLRYDGSFHRSKPVLGGNDVFLPVETPDSPVLHTVVACDLPSSGEVNCHGKSLLSGYSQEYHVSRSRIYLAVEGFVYSMGLEDDQTRVHRIAGDPVDQFSFDEKGDRLRMVTTQGGSIQFEELLLNAFDAFGEQSPRIVHSTPGIPHLNRFVGDFVIVSAYESGYSYFGNAEAQVIAYPWGGTQTSSLSLSGFPVRLEPIGEAKALVVTQENRTTNTYLGLNLIQLGQTSSLADRIELEGRQGEWRSHGFFFKPEGSGGIFGLPILNSQYLSVI